MQLRRSSPAALVAVAVLAVTGCSSDDAAAPTTAANAATVAPTAATTTSAVPSSSEPAATTPSTTAAATTTDAPTTTAAPTTTVSTLIESRQIGESVEGRPIIADRRGTPGGRVILVIGVIHGNENDGLAIMDRLHAFAVPPGVDLWLVDSMNPDGVAHNSRHNAHQVDLNRNFPDNWGPIGVPGDGEYSGPSAASEPETQAMVAFISEIRPDVTLWYHQDLFRIAPGRGRDGRIRSRYAELTSLPVVNITGGTYTGVAATWARNLLRPGVAFIVELGASVTDAEADMHANAVLTIAAEDI